MELPIALLLPYPPSDNERYEGRSKHLSKKARQFRQEVEILALENRGKLAPIEESSRAIIYQYPKNNKRDPQNCLKILLDSLVKSRILKDDNNVSAAIHVCGNHPSDAIIVEFWPISVSVGVPEKKTLECRWNETVLDRRFENKTFAAKHAVMAVTENVAIVNWSAFNNKQKKLPKGTISVEDFKRMYLK